MVSSFELGSCLLEAWRSSKLSAIKAAGGGAAARLGACSASA
jgi:hypothetical protein